MASTRVDHWKQDDIESMPPDTVHLAKLGLSLEVLLATCASDAVASAPPMTPARARALGSSQKPIEAQPASCCPRNIDLRVPTCGYATGDHTGAAGFVLQASALVLITSH